MTGFLAALDSLIATYGDERVAAVIEDLKRKHAAEKAAKKGQEP